MHALVTRYFKDNKNAKTKSVGFVEQIIGPVVDIQFSKDLPALNTIIFISKGENDFVVAEVRQFLGSGSVRAIALESSDGLKRGSVVFNSDEPLKIPVGNPILG